MNALTVEPTEKLKAKTRLALNCQPTRWAATKNAAWRKVDPPHGILSFAIGWVNLVSQPTKLKQLLATVAEANTKLQGLLSQGANGTFHLLGNHNNWCLRF